MFEEVQKSDKFMQNVPSYHNNNSSFLTDSTSDNLNNKTINEAWSEINQQKHVKDNVHVIGDEPNLVMASQSQDWLPLALQMPLAMQMPMPLPMQMPSINIQQQDHHHQNQQIIDLDQNFDAAKSVYENKLTIDYSENSLATCSESKGDVAAATVDVGIGRKHKNSNEMMEKTVERKQKRMAKNRESAAKSRAKKQEYINKLEMEKIGLQKINIELKMRKKIDEEFFSNLTPRYQLRRTSSAKF